MRTGANFARGSCRALKWMLVLGALSVMGSVQAVAQPTIEEATYSAADENTRVVRITMSEAVFHEGDDQFALHGRFTLKGGTIAADGINPIRIVGLAETIGTADSSFDLGFEEPIHDLAGASGQLTLEYTAEADDGIVSVSRQDLAAITATSPILVVPDMMADSRLTLELTPAQEAALEKARPIGTVYPKPATATTLAEKIVLPAATGVASAVTVTYTLGPEASLTALGLTFNATATGDFADRELNGTLPNIVGAWALEYTATAEGHDPATVFFTFTVADTPDAPPEPTVAAASPSSLKVTWGASQTNYAKLEGYALQYMPKGSASWLPDADGIAVAGRTYTISGLAPGEYEVRVRVRATLDGKDVFSPWSIPGSGSTGAGPQKPTLGVTVDPTMPEGRSQIPVTVMATVPPSAAPSRSLKVTLTLKGTPRTLAEDAAELPNMDGLPSDLAWVGATTKDKPTEKVVTLDFNSNLSSEGMVYLTTTADVDAEDEAFRITASTKADTTFSGATAVNKDIVIDDTQEQVYKLQLPVALESSGEIDEGNGDEAVEMQLVVTPARTVPKSFFVSLSSAQDSASDYSLTSRGVSSGGPTAVSLRVDLSADQGTSGDIMLTSASNDGDRVDDTITLQVFETSATSPTTAGDQVGDDVMLKVVDQHKLPTVTMDSIMVDGAEVTSLKEGETGTVTLMADRGTATDDVPDGEKITVALTHGAASSASAADYSLSAETVTISATSGTFMLEVLADDEIDAEELVLQASVTGVAMYGEAADTVDLGPISLMDGTTKLVYPKTDEEIQAVIYPAKDAGMGDDMMFNPGETIEIASPGSLFNTAEGVTLSFTAESDMEDVATVAVSGSGMVTVTAQDMAGVMAHITITAHASVAATAAKGLPQTDPSEASVIFPVTVGLEALSFMLTGPEDMNLVEGGMGGMVTATANRDVTADVTINLMRDRAMSTADDMDFMAEAITIEAGMMSGTTMVMAEEDSMMEDMEELVLYGMAADNAGEVTGQVMFYIWDDAVPALPIIAQLLLAALMAIGGYRRYRRR